jgi:hypothetical protein
MPENNPMKKIRKYVHEFYGSNPKELINNPQEMIILGKVARISRKSVKYIVHSRAVDSYSAAKIIGLLIKAGEVLDNPELDIPNHNKKYPGSRIYGRLDAEEDEALLVICMLSGAMKKVFNAFYRSAGKYEKMF